MRILLAALCGFALDLLIGDPECLAPIHPVVLMGRCITKLEGVLRARFRVGEIDVVLPMPSTLFHRWNRSYNQCAILTRPLARRIGKPYAGFVLRRKGHPRKQSGLDEDERRRNAVGTFTVMRPSAVAGKTVLVVDDIMTTGATLSECAAELRRAGAERVWCVTLASSLRSV